MASSGATQGLTALRTFVGWIATPSFWGTVLGLLGIATGHPVIGSVLLLSVGYGGCGIALSIGVNADHDPWRMDTVLEAILEALRFRRMRCLVGLATHLPQAVLGTVFLARVV